MSQRSRSIESQRPMHAGTGHTANPGRPWVLLLLLMCLNSPAPAQQLEAAQSDWSGGGGQLGPVAAYADSFAAASTISWRAIPGQLALSSLPRESIADHPLTTDLPGAYAVYGADVDDDGDTDLLAAAYPPNAYTLWRNDGGDPTRWTEIPIPASDVGGISICTGDVDDDERTDIVGASWNSGTVSWWRNNGEDVSTWVQEIIGTGMEWAHQVCVADMESDGDLDVFAVAASANCLRWWHNHGGDPIVWTEQTISTTVPGGRAVGAADLDRDGDCDVVAAAFDTHDILVFTNEGGNPIEWSRHLVEDLYYGAHWVAVADVDGDGNPDFLGAAYLADGIDWWRNEGGSPPVFTRIPVDHAFDGAVTVDAADLDGDGDLDIVGTAWEAGELAWWENIDGAGTTWSKRTVDRDLVWASGVHAADVDGDGDMDPLGTAVSTGEVAWWEATVFESQGNLTGTILDLCSEPESLTVAWSARLPAGTALAVELRSGQDPEDLEEWAHTLYEPGTIPEPFGRYLQYRIHLETTDGDASPIVEQIRFTWPAAGSGVLQGLEDASSPFRWIAPAVVGESVSFRLKQSLPLRLEVFDAAGRCVLPGSMRSIAAGRHELRLASLPAGLYWCRASVPGACWIRRVAVVR